LPSKNYPAAEIARQKYIYRFEETAVRPCESRCNDDGEPAPIRRPFPALLLFADASSESRELSGSIFANFTRWHVTKGRSRGGGTVTILPIERSARSSLAVSVAIR